MLGNYRGTTPQKVGENFGGFLPNSPKSEPEKPPCAPCRGDSASERRAETPSKQGGKAGERCPLLGNWGADKPLFPNVFAILPISPTPH